MAKTITQLPDATTVNDADELIIQQSGVTKRATKAELLSAISATTITASGLITASGGITLGNETLSVYDEGTFTPTVTGGFTSPTYAGQYGIYTRIGNRCFFHLRVILNGGTATGSQIVIGSLPFTAKTTGSDYFPCSYYLAAGAAGGQHVRPLVLPNTTTIGLYVQNATNVTAISGTTIGNTMDILVTGTYQIA